MANEDAVGTAINKTLEFKGIGKFTLRGITAGESQRIMERNMDERTGKLNQLETQLEKLSLALEESPSGPHPPVVYLKGLLEGMVQKMFEETAKLSSVDLVLEKK